MKKVNKEILKEAANKMLFDMSEEQYATLLKEFDVILKQMDLISQIEGVDDVEPMTFPYPVYSTYLREDVVKETLTQEEALKNAKDVSHGMIKLPKVVK